MKTNDIIDSIIESCDTAPEVCKGDSRMAKGDLDTIIRDAQELQSLLEEDYPLEDWAKAKITKAESYIQSVLQNVRYEKTQEGEPEDSASATTIYIATNPKTLGLQDTE